MKPVQDAKEHLAAIVASGIELHDGEGWPVRIARPFPRSPQSGSFVETVDTAGLSLIWPAFIGAPRPESDRREYVACLWKFRVKMARAFANLWDTAEFLDRQLSPGMSERLSHVLDLHASTLSLHHHHLPSDDVRESLVMLRDWFEEKLEDALREAGVERSPCDLELTADSSPQEIKEALDIAAGHRVPQKEKKRSGPDYFRMIAAQTIDALRAHGWQIKPAIRLVADRWDHIWTAWERGDLATRNPADANSPWKAFFPESEPKASARLWGHHNIRRLSKEKRHELLFSRLMTAYRRHRRTR